MNKNGLWTYEFSRKEVDNYQRLGIAKALTHELGDKAVSGCHIPLEVLAVIDPPVATWISSYHTDGPEIIVASSKAKCIPKRAVSLIDNGKTADGITIRVWHHVRSYDAVLTLDYANGQVSP